MLPPRNLFCAHKCQALSRQANPILLSPPPRALPLLLSLTHSLEGREPYYLPWLSLLLHASHLIRCQVIQLPSYL